MRRLLHKLFLQSGREERASRLLRSGASVGMLAMVIISFTAVNLQALLWQSSHWLVSAVLPAVVVELTNEERAALAEQPLVRNSVLDEAARLKAEDMAKHQYFAHYSPDGVSPWHWFKEAGYTYAHAGENLAIHFSDSGEVVEAWMESPSHRANIVSGNYTEIGVGTARGVYDGVETVFVVQLFGAPADPLLVARAEALAAEVAIAAVVPEPQSQPLLPPPPVSTGATVTATGTGEVLAEVTAVPEVIDGGTASATLSDMEPFTTASSAALINDIDTVTTPEMVRAALPGEIVSNGMILKAPEYETPEPVFVVAAMDIANDTVSVYSGLMATSSGYPLYVKAPGETSGATKVAVIGKMATQPTVVLQVIYAVLGSIVTLMLFLALLLGVRAERPWQIVYSVLMLIVMGGLVTLHVYVTSGALVV